MNAGTVRQFAAAAAITVIFTGAALARDGGGQALRTKTYDMKHLLLVEKDFPGPDLTIAPDVRENMTSKGELPRKLMIEPDMIEDLVRRLAAPDSWDEPGRSLRIVGNALEIRQTDEIHARVAALFKAVADRLLRSVSVEAVVISADLGLIRSIVGANPVLDDQRRATLMDAVSKGEKAEILDVVRLDSLAGVRSHALSSFESRYVRELDVEVAQGASQLYPLQGLLKDGSCLDVMATPDSRAERVMLDVRFTQSERLGQPEQFSTGLEHGGKLQLHKRRARAFNATIVVPAGRSALLGLAAAEGAPAGRCTALLITAVPHALKAESEQAKGFTVVDGRFAGHRAPDFSVLPLGGLEIALDEDFIWVEEEQCPWSDPFAGRLDEMLKSATGYEAWDSGENVMASLLWDIQIVSASKPVADRCSGWLRDFENQAANQVMVRAIFLSAGAAEIMSNPLLRPGASLDQAALDSLLSGQSAKPFKVLGEAALTGMNGQRVCVTEHREFSLLMEYVAEIAQESSIADPITRKVRDGVSLTVRPAVDAFGGRIALEVDASYAALPEGRVPEIGDLGKRLGIVQLPSLSAHRVKARVSVQDGRAVVLGVSSSPAGGVLPRGQALLVIVFAKSLGN